MKKLILLMLLIIAITFGCTETQEETNFSEELAISQSRIIELQENEKYLRKEKENYQEDLKDIRKVYSKLFTDGSACYWAITCRDYPTFCEEAFNKGMDSTWTAKELADMQTRNCERMELSWEEYTEYDEELKDE